MSVDRNLFLHDLAIVAILKNEGPYLKEWLDYHLLAGVSHFYLYDNSSTDNYAAIVRPYVEAGIVTSKYFPGESMQFAAYDDAVQNYRFYCRNMAFIDLDEFLFPKSTTEPVTATLDEIFDEFPNASGLAINWQLFGSNGEKTADYSRGVLERFTRRAQSDWVVPIPKRTIPGGNAQVKTVANPRRIAFFTSPHFPIYFEENYSVNERGKFVASYCNEPVTAEKIVINHYNVKSLEEHRQKILKGRAGKQSSYLDSSWFDMYDRNEIFDDSILTYRAARAEKFSLASDEQRLARVTDALTKNLSRFANNMPPQNSLEVALTCRALSSHLRKNFPDNANTWRLYEETSLAAVLKSFGELKLPDTQLFISELPELLPLQYPVVEELRDTANYIISQLMDFMREKERWKDFADLDYLRRMLRNFKG